MSIGLRSSIMARIAALLIASLFTLTSFTTNTVAAQSGTTLSGKVTQADNKQPLAGALVVIDELRREVRAGDDGTFTFDGVPPGLYHVGVRAEGYSTRRTEVTVASQPITLDIAIDFDLHFTEVLSVSPDARPQFESYQPTSVLAGQELAKNLEATVGATLAETPGVALREFGPGPARPVIRGLDGDRISVLEDGERMGDLSSQSGDHATPTNPAAARKIEVVRGPATLLYGASAIGGMVNVITDQIPTEPTRGSSGNINLNFGSNGGAAGGAGHPRRQRQVCGPLGGESTAQLSTPEGEIDNSQSRMAMEASAPMDRQSATLAPATATTTRSGIVVEKGRSLTPRRHC